MDSRLTIAGRELAGLRAEKTILLAIGIQLFIAAFSSFLVVGLFLAPLALHGFATALAAVGARRNRTYYAITLVVATLIHAAYNVGVVSLHG